jgi:RNA polymerase sigma factor (sigma-70 family)
MPTPDQILIDELKQGKDRAFKELVEKYQQRVYNTCLGFVKNPEEADDLTQEVYIEVFRSILKFRMDSKLSTWIYRITVNKSLETLRAKKRKKRLAQLRSLFYSDNSVIEVPDFEHPGVIVENKERSKILFQAMEKLPESQRVTYTLHKVEGLGYEEIANIMKKTVSSVESTMHRAKNNLQKYLYDYYYEEKNEDRKYSALKASK